MWRMSAFGFALILLSLGSAVIQPTFAQASSAFPFTLPASSLALCWYFGAAFSATGGQQFVVQWNQTLTGSVPVSVNFYITQLDMIHNPWLCDNGPTDLYWNDGAYGTVNWSAPSAGPYAAIVVNYSGYQISGMLSVATINATISASPIGPLTTIRRLPICIYLHQNC